MRFQTAFALAATLGVCAIPARAQSSFIPGAEVNGQINVQVNVTLDDGAGYFEPVAHHALTLYRNATDSTQVQTDEAGVLRFAVAPGSYRIASTSPVAWRGRGYRWNVPLIVERRMSLINLTPANAAIVSARSTAMNPRAAARSDGSGAVDAPMAVGYSRKDGTTGVLFSFLITGAGQMYAGKTGKGVGLLATGLLSGVAFVAGLNASYNSSLYGDSNSAADAVAVGGGLLAVGTWIYSMASAPGDVREYNMKHSAYARVRPVLDRHDGHTGLGLALAF